MFSEISIAVKGISKCYRIYDKPQDRLLQMLVRGRKRYFREFWALQDISFEVKSGEAFGIIGRNGSGKSTLLQIICGILNPTGGSTQINGRIAALLELGAGFNPEFTGRENAYMTASLYGLQQSEINDRFDKIAAFADIGQFIDQPVKTYSSGMYVRLAFAVIANVDADILVIDEALAVGDALFTQKCMRFIRKFREEHSLLFVSHDTASVINLCDRALWLSNGELVSIGASKGVCESYLNSLFQAMNEPSDPPSEQYNAVYIKRIGQQDLCWSDHRSKFINASNLRNDLEVFKFHIDTSSEYGGTDAHIVSVELADSNGVALHWVVGGEKVTLRIVAEAHVTLQRPILGFYIKDRLGQTLFGDNTHLNYADHPCLIPAGEMVIAEFDFFMPWFALGDYAIQAAIAEGTNEEHRQLHWVHEALIFRAHHSPLSTGIIGIPTSDIRLSVMSTQR